MKIIEECNAQENKVVYVLKAKYVSDFALRITFSDNSEATVDFKPFLSKSKHPLIRKYLDEQEFKKFQIIEGNLNWNDYELIFPIWDLYKGKIK